LAATLDSVRAHLDDFGSDDRPRAEALLAKAGDIDERLRRITSRKIGALRIRCHGDYHLGQVLYTGKDFVLIDFEGEPARAISERRFKRNPLRDVAGMLRSFHYAEVSALRSREEAHTEVESLEPWSHAWTEWVSALYLGAYLESAEGLSALPKNPQDVETLLQFYLLEKCIYELGYELNHRPDWAAIPMAGLEQLLAHA
jgi:maltose alpha-D-glucosyltransferase/alpha-amylase